MKKAILAALLGTALLAPAALAHSDEAKGVKLGVLNCQIEGGIGYIIGSSKKVHCNFDRTDGRSEHYNGSMGKLGIDVGVTDTAYMSWVVFAPGELHHGGLAGSYVGASAQATVIVGLGANVLIGGFDDTVNLQPLSVQGQTGLNVAAGLASLHLHSVH